MSLVGSAGVQRPELRKMATRFLPVTTERSLLVEERAEESGSPAGYRGKGGIACRPERPTGCHQAASPSCLQHQPAGPSNRFT